jgi:glycosyltransferase involved in cell wall biosynthesis
VRLIRIPIRLFVYTRKLGPVVWIEKTMGKVIRIDIGGKIKKFIWTLVPHRFRHFYEVLRFEHKFRDSSEVTLFANPDILPGYQRRCSMEPELQEEQYPVKISLISTVKNEADNAQLWLDSLLQQSRLPDEVVITDGGSTDGTVGILLEYAKSFPIPLKVIEAPGTNIARGRNLAIEDASYSVLACTDFGCVLDRDWLKNLVFPFEINEEIQVSSGYYQAIVVDDIDQLTSGFFISPVEHINPSKFLPSSRSLAMRKNIWEKVGGYPEWLTDAGEDTLFDMHLKSQPAHWAFVPSALVSWRAPRTMAKIYKTFFRYSRGDGETGLFAPLYWDKFKQLFSLIAFAWAAAVLTVIAWLLFGFYALLIPILIGASAVYRELTHKNIPRRSFKLALLRLFYRLAIHMAQVQGYLKGAAERSNVELRQVNQQAEILRKILEEESERKGIIIYPPTHDWSFMFQRPQQMALAFARKGYLYFYCTNNERSDSVHGFSKIRPHLYLCHVPMQMFRELNEPVVYVGSAWHRQLLDVFQNPVIIYDHYDDLDVSSAKQEDHDELLRRAHIAVVTSGNLQEAVKNHRPDAIMAPNAVDYDFILSQQPISHEAVPSELKAIKQKGKPVVGYTGALAQWFDYDLLSCIAIRRPDVEFVLIGVSYDGSLEKSNVLNCPNVHYFGMKPYTELFKYMWEFDVGIIPFKINSITLATSPIKLFEYMACQLPVVTSALPECRLYPGVFVAETTEEFIEHLHSAIHAKTDPDYLEIILNGVKDNTWDNRVDKIINRLNGLSDKSGNVQNNHSFH